MLLDKAHTMGVSAQAEGIFRVHLLPGDVNTTFKDLIMEYGQASLDQVRNWAATFVISCFKYVILVDCVCVGGDLVTRLRHYCPEYTQLISVGRLGITISGSGSNRRDLAQVDFSFLAEGGAY
jgi:hypothetical protein